MLAGVYLATEGLMKETRMTWPVLRRALMKQVTIIGMGCLLAVALSWALITCSALYHNHDSLGIRCGLLTDA